MSRLLLLLAAIFFSSSVSGVAGSVSAELPGTFQEVIRRNKFFGNTADDQHLSGVVSFVNTSSPVIVNNIFRNNPSRAINMTLPEGSSPTVINNTIVRNGVGIRVNGTFASQHYYGNNILVGNKIGFELDSRSPDNDPTWTHNLVFNNTANYSGIPTQTGRRGNISVAPLFEDISTSNFRLQPASPALDAGLLSARHLPKLDYAGNRRVVDGNGDSTARPDIGAFEFIP